MSVKVEKIIIPTYLEPKKEDLPMFAEHRVHHAAGTGGLRKPAGRVRGCNQTLEPCAGAARLAGVFAAHPCRGGGVLHGAYQREVR